MHEKLKFSFGHIIAFLALMALGYVVFMSVTYYTKGSYLLAGAVALGIMALLLLLLFRLQLLKGVNSNFEKKIIHERITLVIFTLVCIASFVVFSHFWTVESKKDEVAGKFNQAMVVSQQLFDDYDIYATNRIESYSQLLADSQTPAANNNAKNSNKAKNSTVSASQKADSLTRSLLVKGLELQLRPQQYKDLQFKAEKWIDKAQSNFSIWNVFLLGNIDNIGASMNNWNEMMGELSTHRMNAEHDTVFPFNRSEVIDQSVQELELIKEICAQTSFPTKNAWLAGLVFMLLYLPWIIQARSPKSMVNILGKRKKTGGYEIKTEPKVIKPQKPIGTLDDNDQHVKPTTKKAGQLDNNNGDSSQSKRGGISLDI